MIPSPYQTQLSPIRVAAIIQIRNQRGARQKSSPFLAETNFVDPVIQSECRNQYCQRRSQQSPRLFAKERFHDAVHVQRELEATAVLSLDASLARAQARQELLC